MNQIKKRPETRTLIKERMKGVEPSSSAWKAEIMSRYMTSASDILNITNAGFYVNGRDAKILKKN